MSKLKIGTRGSPLALAQAKLTRSLICKSQQWSEQDIEICVIKTTGDMVQNRLLSEIGGKGLFTKEIEERLLDGSIDLAVHSSKDMATTLPDGLELSTFLAREDRRDAILSFDGASVQDLPRGAKIGSASLRRLAIAKMLRPDLTDGPMRGNVGTRMDKLRQGDCSATFLAMAGLIRLGIDEDFIHPLDPDDFMPAPGQGAIGIEIVKTNDRIRDILAPLDHAPTHSELIAERAFLRALDGSCRTPLAALTQISGDQISIKGMVLRPDGTDSIQGAQSGALGDADALGKQLGERLRAQMPADFWVKL